ncbi:hypothetical protein V8G54_006681 [Vigna mungo]|uniref:Secreted protein n=1 Tax=Vigna mungo TaxID=3915 RepID=A0AAQ3S4S9_VIGMU
MLKAYLLWSIHGLAAAPHCGLPALDCCSMPTTSFLSSSDSIWRYFASLLLCAWTEGELLLSVVSIIDINTYMLPKIQPTSATVAYEFYSWMPHLVVLFHFPAKSSYITTFTAPPHPHHITWKRISTVHATFLSSSSTLQAQLLSHFPLLSFNSFLGG